MKFQFLRARSPFVLDFLRSTRAVATGLPCSAHPAGSRTARGRPGGISITMAITSISWDITPTTRVFSNPINYWCNCTQVWDKINKLWRLKTINIIVRDICEHNQNRYFMEVYKGCVVWDEHKQPNIMFGGSAWTGANVILRILNCRGCHGDKIHPSSPT